MASPSEQIDRLIQDRHASTEQVNTHAAARALLGYLSPHNDDGQQPYVEVLRRLQAAITLELQRSIP